MHRSQIEFTTSSEKCKSKSFTRETIKLKGKVRGQFPFVEPIRNMNSPVQRLQKENPLSARKSSEGRSAGVTFSCADSTSKTPPVPKNVKANPSYAKSSEGKSTGIRSYCIDSASKISPAPKNVKDNPSSTRKPSEGEKSGKI